MIWMVLFVLAAASFNHTVRYAQVLRRNMPWVGAMHYCTGAIVFGVWWVFRWGGTSCWAALTIGVLAGIVSSMGYFLLNWAIPLAGVGLVQTTGRLSVVVPIAASILIWHEIPDFVRSIGLTLALVSLPILMLGQPVKIPPHKQRERTLALLAFFSVIGMSGILFKAAAEYVTAENHPGFLFFIFATGSIGALLVAAGKGGRPRFGDVAHGTVLGVLGVAINYSAIAALAALPGWLFFPTTSVGTILLSTTVATVLWRERFRGRALAGIVIAVAAIVLINVDLSQLIAALRS